MTPSQKASVTRLWPQAVRSQDDELEIWDVSCEIAGVESGTLADDMPEFTEEQASRFVAHLKEMAGRRRCEYCGAHIRDSHDAAQHSLVDAYHDGGGVPACGLS
jgi:hypothetical protein